MALGLRAIRRVCRTDRRGLLSCLSIGIMAAATAAPAAARHKVRKPSRPRADAPPTRCVSDIPRLLDDLSARRYPRRQRATDRLKAYGPEAYPHLIAAFERSTTPEVRLRLRGIAEHIFLREAAGAREGFLGIQFHVVTQAHDPRLAAGQRGLVVMSVVDNAPADRAGLRAGDVIVRFNHAPISADPGGDAFTRSVRSLRPGMRVPVEALRGDERRSLHARLSARPARFETGADRERADARCRKWLRDCFSHETAELAVRTVRTDRR